MWAASSAPSWEARPLTCTLLSGPCMHALRCCAHPRGTDRGARWPLLLLPRPATAGKRRARERACESESVAALAPASLAPTHRLIRAHKRTWGAAGAARGPTGANNPRTASSARDSWGGLCPPPGLSLVAIASCGGRGRPRDTGRLEFEFERIGAPGWWCSWASGARPRLTCNPRSRCSVSCNSACHCACIAACGQPPSGGTSSNQANRPCPATEDGRQRAVASATQAARAPMRCTACVGRRWPRF